MRREALRYGVAVERSKSRITSSQQDQASAQHGRVRLQCVRMVPTEAWTEGGRDRETVFGSERELVAQFVAALVADGAPWGYLRVTSEFFYGRGRVDVLGACEKKRVIAFEAKLTRWREALHQAYRNTCLAHRSYVVLPAHVAARALSSQREFQKLGVGLCTLIDGRVVILLDVPPTDPIQPWLALLAAESVSVSTRGPGADGRS